MRPTITPLFSEENRRPPAGNLCATMPGPSGKIIATMIVTLLLLAGGVLGSLFITRSVRQIPLRQPAAFLPAIRPVAEPAGSAPIIPPATIIASRPSPSVQASTPSTLPSSQHPAVAAADTRSGGNTARDADNESFAAQKPVETVEARARRIMARLDAIL